MPRTSVKRGGALLGSAKSALSGLNAYRNQLLSERSAIDSKLDAINDALRAMGNNPSSSGGGIPGGRAPRKGSLKEYIGRVLSASGSPMAVKDIASGVTKAGYKSRNKTLAKSVGIALTQMPAVTKVGRGLFKG